MELQQVYFLHFMLCCSRSNWLGQIKDSETGLGIDQSLFNLRGSYFEAIVPGVRE